MPARVKAPARQASRLCGSTSRVGQATGKTGVLIANLGTPSSPETGDVRRYLREFLSDPRVLDIAALPRWLLVNAVIAPFRAPRSAAAYRKIWTERGSPLLAQRPGSARRARGRARAGVRGRARHALRRAVARARARRAAARTTSRASCSCRSFRSTRRRRPARRSSACTRWSPQRWNVPALDHAARVLRRAGLHRRAGRDRRAPARGVPSRPRAVQLPRPAGAPDAQERRDRPTLSGVGRLLRRDRQPRTATATARSATRPRARWPRRCGLAAGAHSTAFQSRLGRTPWITPHTDAVLPELARAGAKRLAVLCPSFVADCLETLEEIGLRARRAVALARRRGARARAVRERAPAPSCASWPSACGARSP